MDRVYKKDSKIYPPIIKPTFEAGIITSIKASPGAIVGTDI